MTSSLKNQCVVITGASSGVGRACAQAFGREGARVALIARNEEALRAAANEVKELGGEALVLPLDVTDVDAMYQAADHIVEQWGVIDIWINTAMVTVFAPVTDVTPEEFRRVTEVTYLGYVYGTLAALRHMQPRNEGRIIQVGSAMAYRSIPLQSAYCGAKAAIRAFTDSLRCELIHDNSNIKISMPQLPAINTPQSVRQRAKVNRQPQPVPPMLKPEAIAETIVWTAKTMPREPLLGSNSLAAVWGQHIAPGLADLYLGKRGYQAQLTDIPHDPHAPDILFDTLPGDPGAHGPYSDRARGPDWQIRLRTLPRTGMLAAGLAATGALALLGRMIKS